MLGGADDRRLRSAALGGIGDSALDRGQHIQPEARGVLLARLQRQPGDTPALRAQLLAAHRQERGFAGASGRADDRAGVLDGAS